MKAYFFNIKRNCKGKYPVKFEYLIVGDELELLEFEMQKGVFARREEGNRLIFTFPWYYGEKVNVVLNPFNNRYSLDTKEHDIVEAAFNQVGENYWIDLYKLTRDKKWLINRVDFIPEYESASKGAFIIPKELKTEINRMKWN